jgi:hypothetical protein
MTFCSKTEYGSVRILICMANTNQFYGECTVGRPVLTPHWAFQSYNIQDDGKAYSSPELVIDEWLEKINRTIFRQDINWRVSQINH